MIASPWKISLLSDPAVVLLNFGERIADEIDWGGAKLINVVPLIRAASPLIRDGGNLSYQIGFTVQRSAASDALHRTSMLDGLIEFGASDKQILKVEATGITTHYWTFSQAVIQSRRCQGRTVSAALSRTSITIIAAGLSKVTVP